MKTSKKIREKRKTKQITQINKTRKKNKIIIENDIELLKKRNKSALKELIKEYPQLQINRFLEFKPQIIQLGEKKLIMRIGRTKYESPYGLIIQDFGAHNPIFSMKLNIVKQKDVIFIVALQGNPEVNNTIKHLTKELKMPIPNYMFQELKKYAKQEGFKKIKLRKPQTLAYYDVPAELPYGKIYDKIFRKHELTITEAKKINQFLDILKIHDQRINLKRLRKNKKMEIARTKSILKEVLYEFMVFETRNNMKKLYYNFARKNGFKKREEYFEIEL